MGGFELEYTVCLLVVRVGRFCLSYTQSVVSWYRVIRSIGYRLGLVWFGQGRVTRVIIQRVVIVLSTRYSVYLLEILFIKANGLDGGYGLGGGYILHIVYLLERFQLEGKGLWIVNPYLDLYRFRISERKSHIRNFWKKGIFILKKLMCVLFGFDYPATKLARRVFIQNRLVGRSVGWSVGSVFGRLVGLGWQVLYKS